MAAMLEPRDTFALVARISRQYVRIGSNEGVVVAVIRGFWSTFGLCVVGGFIAEGIRVIAAFRKGKPPSRSEYVVSAIYAAMGGGAVLYGWSTRRPAIELATLGAAFPTLFAAGVAAAVAPGDAGKKKGQAKKALAKKAPAIKATATDAPTLAPGPVLAAGPSPRRTLDYMAGRF